MKIKIIVFGALLIFAAIGGIADAQIALPIDGMDEQAQVASTLEIVALITVLSLVPAFVLMTTCFTRIIVVLSFLRQALALQQLPPNQILIGLALFMTIAIMAPTWHKAYEAGIGPYMEKGIDPETKKQITLKQAYERSIIHIKDFMIVHTEQNDLELFLNINKVEFKDKNKEDITTEDISLAVIIPSFMISELKKAFWMGFLLYLPFLIIDMVVASVLMSMGMMMLPPVMISLPFKVLLFVMVDGWNLITASMVASYVET